MLQLHATLLNSGSLKNNTKKNTCIWNIYETYNKHAFTTAPLPGASKAMIFQRIFNGPSPRMIAAFKLHVDDMATKTKKTFALPNANAFSRQLLKTSSSFRLQGPHNIHVYIRVWDAIPDYRSNSFGPLWFFFLGLCMVHFSDAALVFFNHLPKVSTQWMGDQKRTSTW